MIMIEKLDNRDFSLTCKFKTLLYCICENLWKMVLKKRQAAANYLIRNSEATEDEDISDTMDRSMYNEIIQKVFDSLDPVGKKILILYWENISPREIAEKLGYSYNYVRRKKCEVQAELIGKIKKHPDYIKIINSGLIAENVVY
jgi:RNA polymerase sigma factor (sigma-70 family)